MSFATINTVEYVHAQYWWSYEFFDNRDRFDAEEFIIKDKIQAFVNQLVAKYPEVSENTGFRCQFEGFELIVDTLEVAQVVLEEVNKFLATIPEIKAI